MTWAVTRVRYMAESKRSNQPRYSTGRRGRPIRGRRTGSSKSTMAKRRTTVLIVVGIIVALVFCWVFGRGCGGNQEARENEELREYTTESNKLITRSSTVGTQFDALRQGIAEVSRDDASRKLTQMVEDCKEIAKEAKKMKVPENATGLQPSLELTLDLRTAGIDKYRASILDVLDNKDTEKAVAMMSEGLMDLVISDEALQRFRGTLEGKLKAANLSFEKVADSVYVANMDNACTAAVVTYIQGLSGAETGEEVHGVAIVGMTTSPARVDRTESGVSILPFSTTFTVKVTVENQGNQVEEDVSVVVTLNIDPEGTPQKETQKITRLKAGETAALVFEELKPATGTDKANIMKVIAGPVEGESKVDNNETELTFIMRSE